MARVNIDINNTDDFVIDSTVVGLADGYDIMTANNFHNLSFLWIILFNGYVTNTRIHSFSLTMTH